MIVLWFLELILGAHCNAWRMTEHGWRCIAPIDRPRIELVRGWHRANPGGETCSIACGRDDLDEPLVLARGGSR